MELLVGSEEDVKKALEEIWNFQAGLYRDRAKNNCFILHMGKPELGKPVCSNKSFIGRFCQIQVLRDVTPSLDIKLLGLYDSEMVFDITIGDTVCIEGNRMTVTHKRNGITRFTRITSTIWPIKNGNPM